MTRSTRQHRAIRQALAQAGRPLSAQEVHKRACAMLPRLGLATVYRNLNALEAEGYVAVVEVPGTASRYELAALPHHHHFICRGCGRVYDVPGCGVRLDALAPSGFTVDGHELVLYGACADCA